VIKILKVPIAALLLLVFSQTAMADGAHMAVFTKQAGFAEVKESVEQSITGRGFVINNVSHVGDMLERTGKDLGNSKRVFVHAEALEFCSATVSRRMMEPDADNIVFCPYIISIYVVPQKPTEVRVAFRKTQMVGSKESQEALKAVDKLLTEIIEEAIQ